MELELHDRAVVVTGASRGIGLATARAFAAEGARVVAAARTVGEDLGALDEVIAVEVDLADAEGPETLIERAVAELGSLDVLVNNVGAVAPREGFLSVSDEDWRWTLDVNLFSAIRAARAALPHLLERGGSIVNVSSVNARVPFPSVVDYSVAKGALTTLTQALAAEFTPQGVRVNTVSPGPVRTPMWTAPHAMAGQMAEQNGIGIDEAIAAIAKEIGGGGVPAGRFAEAEEVAALVLLQASPKASYVTGADWLVDGGVVPTV